MPHPAKGLYAPRLVDLTFGAMGLGSAILLLRGGALTLPHAIGGQASSMSGWVLFLSVMLVVASACLMHRIDQKGWDDYMGQVVSQSALIGMISVILTGVLFDFLIAPWFTLTTPPTMIQGMVPIACLSWSVGYLFLRWKGTGA